MSRGRAHGWNAAASPTRSWTINGDFVSLKPNGVARYGREVTLALDRLMSEGHPLTHNLSLQLVAPRASELQLDEIPIHIVPEYNRPRLPQFWVQCQLPRHVPGGLISFCNLAPIGVRRHIACIHDLQTRTSPASYSWSFRMAHRVILPLLGRSAAAITTVSQLSRSELARHGIAPLEKISVTYNGSDHAARWRPERSGLDLTTRRPFVLCILRSEEHKNSELLIRLARPLEEMGIDMLMVGDINPATAAQLASSEAGNIRLLGRISDDDLAAAYSRALCFLLPSRVEGFGLPAVEAMIWGCPVIASDRPCLPEICDDAALFAKPDDDLAWLAAISRILQMPGLRERLAEAGRERAKLFTWRNIALAYLRLMAVQDPLGPDRHPS